MNQYQKLAEGLKGKTNTWLVTGSAGFIGSHIAIRLLSLNQKVIGFDNFSTGSQKNIDIIAKQAQNKEQWTFYKADLNDSTALTKALENVDYVIHQAALGSVPRSLKDPLNSHLSNVDGFIKILWASHLAKAKKFVFASSSSVYGSDPHLPKREDRIGHPLSPYAATKRIDEIYAQTFCHCYQLPTVGLRYFNVFGPRQSPEGPYAAVIPIWIDAIKNNQDVFINGDGSNSRDFCYVENVVQANILAALSGNESNAQVFNIAFERQTNLIELHQIIQKEVQQIHSEVKLKPPQHRPNRAGDVPHSLADVSLAKSILGYVPAVDLQAGLKETVQYFFNINQRG